MSAIDSDFYAAFAGRVRQQLATSRSTAPEGDTMNGTRTETAPAVPATFQAAPDAPCERNAWCCMTGVHADCYAPEVVLPADDGSEPGILVGQITYDAEDDETYILFQQYAEWAYITPTQLRAETARVRSHLARLDALADQYEAIREADGNPAQAISTSDHLPWCAPGQCIGHADMATEHQGPLNLLPDSRNRAGEPIGYSRLFFSPDDDGAVQISATFRGQGTTYTAPQADALIGDVEAFLTGLKAQRSQIDAKHDTAERFCDEHPWCVKHGDPEIAQPEAVDHIGVRATLPAPAHLDPIDEDPEWLLTVHLNAIDPDYSTPVARMTDSTGEDDLQMTADQVVAFADQLATFRTELLAMAAQLRNGSAA